MMTVWWYSFHPRRISRDLVVIDFCSNHCSLECDDGVWFMLMLMLIFVTRLNSRRSRSVAVYYGQSKLRWYRCVLSCDRNEPTLEAARIVAGRLFQTLGAAIEKRRDAVLVLSRDDERRLHVGLYCSSSDDK